MKRSVPIRTVRGEILHVVGAYLSDGKHYVPEVDDDPPLNIVTDGSHLVVQLLNGDVISLGSYGPGYSEPTVLLAMKYDLTLISTALSKVHEDEVLEGTLIVLGTTLEDKAA